MVQSHAIRASVFNPSETMPVETNKDETSKRDRVLIDFALQGGGSHGAFTWGALDRLLEEPWLQIDGISGTSAGAMNAAVLVEGHAKGGADAARSALEGFWRSVSRAALLSPLRRGFLDVLLDRWTLDHSPVFVAMDMMARVFSPYDLNPGGFNPLQQILAECIDFERLGRAPIKLFVTATNVRNIPQPGDYTRCTAGLGLSADFVPGRRNRGRKLLGRRVFRQPDYHTVGA
jgi:NTE family protein